MGGHFETWNTGILGPVVLRGFDQGKLDLSWQKWTYQVLTLSLATQVVPVTKKNIYEDMPILKTGWAERRGHESCITKWYLFCRVDAVCISFREKSTTDLAQGKNKQKRA